jgi:hypothetical protein
LPEASWSSSDTPLTELVGAAPYIALARHRTLLKLDPGNRPHVEVKNLLRALRLRNLADGEFCTPKVTSTQQSRMQPRLKPSPVASEQRQRHVSP